MNRYLKVFRLRGLDRRYGARLVNYADDFVVLCRHGAAEVLAQTRRWFTQMGLTLNEQKTRVCDGRREPFTFLGYTFGPMRYRKDGHWYLGAAPAKKAVQRVKGRIRQILRPGNQAPWAAVRGGAQPRAARVGALLLLRHAADGLPGGGSLRLRARAALPAATTQGPLARDAALFRGARSSGSWGCSGCGAFIWGRLRMPRCETRPRAGCGKTARPVR